MNKRDLIEDEILNETARFQRRLEYLRNKSKRLSWYRLSVFLISSLFFFIFFFSGDKTLLYATAALFLVIFGILTGIHNKLEMGIRKNILWTKIKQLDLSRLRLSWNELPPSAFFPDNSHPFEADLDIIGDFSLHRLINNASSLQGSRILREWFTNYKPDPVSIQRRQSIIKELIPLNRFRNKLSLYSALISKKELEGTRILQWIKSPLRVQELRKALIILSIIIIFNIISFLLYLGNIIPPFFIIVSAVYVFYYWTKAGYTKGIFDELLVINEEFGKLSLIFDFLENYPYHQGSSLQKFCSPFLKHSPSKDLKKINGIINSVGVTRNPLAGLLLNVIFPYNIFFAYRLEMIKAGIRTDFPVWIDTWYNLEAYNSLAGYARLNPGCTFPVINNHHLKVSALQLSHPLIRIDANVANDFEINNKGEVFIITGSNMSGKSTFLKTIGINLAMAYAGGVVNAVSFSVSLSRIFSCINISDSVTDGISYFYAEVKRLKNLLEELNKADEFPVIFLIDEIFKGTNNIERLQGSRSYLKKAAGLNGSGLVSTHDLELSRLENEIPSVHNFHFREETDGGKMVFDYKIHPGPSPTTNALKIMKNEGLPVD